MSMPATTIDYRPHSSEGDFAALVTAVGVLGTTSEDWNERLRHTPRADVWVRVPVAMREKDKGLEAILTNYGLLGASRKQLLDAVFRHLGPVRAIVLDEDGEPIQDASGNLVLMFHLPPLEQSAHAIVDAAGRLRTALQGAGLDPQEIERLITA